MGTTCPSLERLDLDPVDDDGREALARIRAHARGCSACGRRLAGLERADALLAGSLLDHGQPSGPCPEPEELLGTLSDRLVEHLEGCRSCRTDLLVAAAAARGASSRRLQVAAPRGRVIRFQPGMLAAAAAVLVTAGAAFILLGDPEPGRSVARDPAQPGGTGSSIVEPARDPRGQLPDAPGGKPAGSTTPGRLDPADPRFGAQEAPGGGGGGPSGERRGGPELATRGPSVESPLERGLLPPRPPAPDGGEKDGQLAGTVQVGPPGVVPDEPAAQGELEVLAARGVDQLAPGDARWSPAGPGKLRSGTRLRTASGQSGALRTARGTLYIGAGTQLVTGEKALSLVDGQVFYESARPGQGEPLALEHPLGTLELDGRGLVHGRAGELAVAAVEGTARASHPNGGQATILPGERVDHGSQGQGAPHPITPGNPDPPGPPSWVEELLSQIGPHPKKDKKDDDDGDDDDEDRGRGRDDDDDRRGRGRDDDRRHDDDDD